MADDHLSLVAGISKVQRTELKEWGISTLTALGKAPLPAGKRPKRGTRQGLDVLASGADGWFWDTEVMMLCNLFKYKVYEMPITVIHQELRPTNVKFFQDTLDSLLNSVKIKKRVKKIKLES